MGPKEGINEGEEINQFFQGRGVKRKGRVRGLD